MTTTSAATTVGVFKTREAAERVVAELKTSGCRDDEISMVARNADGKAVCTNGGETRAEEGAVIGAAAGAGVAALASLGMTFGVIPVIGPVLAVGPLAAALISAAGRRRRRARGGTGGTGYPRGGCQILRGRGRGRALLGLR